MRNLLGLLVAIPTIAAAVSAGCGTDAENCEKIGTCAPSTGTTTEGSGASGVAGSGGSGATGGSGGSGGSGAMGGGGSAPCDGACSGDTPLCDETKMECVACLDHDNCTDAGTAKCDDGTCVACDDSAQCVGVTDLDVCDEGLCVECNVVDATACEGGETCDLLANECIDVAAGSVGNCEACSNDDQCEADHRCIALDFQGQPHGHYCLMKQPGCDNPFLATVNKPSLNGVAATNYCGVSEDLATCEAIEALIDDWRCPSGMDGMCGPVNMAEVAVPGALCETVSGGANRCTYACSVGGQCPTGVMCGDGGGSSDYCGG